MRANPIYKTILVLNLILLSYSGYSQPFTGIHFTMSMESCAQVAPDQLEFDLFLQFDGTLSKIELLAYSYGINFNSLILNGGSQNFTQVGAIDPALNTLNTPILNAGTLGHLRITTSPKATGSGVIINSSVQTTSPKYKIGRFRLTNSLPSFATNIPANLDAQCSAIIGKTSLAAIYSLNGATWAQPSTDIVK